MLRKLVGLVLVAAVAWVVTPLSASAQVDYAGCVVSINPPQLRPGQEAQVNGSGLQPGVPTQVVLDRGTATQQVLATVTPNPAGNFNVRVTIPASLAPGQHTISVACGAAAGFATTAVQVLGTQNRQPDLVLSERTVRRLQTFTATVTLAQPGSRVDFAQFSVRVPVGSAVADANGTARLQMSFPANATLGEHEVEAVGTDIDGDPFRLRDPITVVADSVPRTGSDVGPIAAAGIGAVVVGAGLVVGARRRRSAHASG